MKLTIRSLLSLLLALSLVLAFAACKGREQEPQSTPDEIPVTSDTDSPADGDEVLPNDPEPQSEETSDEPIEQEESGDSEETDEEPTEEQPSEDETDKGGSYATRIEPEEDTTPSSGTMIELPFVEYDEFPKP